MARPALSTKQQRFVDRVIAGDSATVAYSAAYGCREAVAAAAGSRLLKHVKIAAAIESRRQKVSAKADLTLASHLAALDALKAQAAAANQFGPAVSAEVSRGKASGFYVDRTETKHSGAVEVRVRIAREGRKRTAG